MSRSIVRTRFVLLGLLAVVVLAAALASACTEEREAAAPPAARAALEPSSAESLPAEESSAPSDRAPGETSSSPQPPRIPFGPIDGPLEQGTTYARSVFLAPLTLTATGKGWHTRWLEEPDEIEILGRNEHFGLVLFAGDRVFSPFNVFGKDNPTAADGTLNSAPFTPSQFAFWLDEHPQLEAGERQRIVLAGREGYMLETVTTGSNVGLFLASVESGRLYVSERGAKTRWYVVDNLGNGVIGDSVVVGAWAKSAVVFERRIDELESVLETIEFT